ncbi:Zn(2)-C6 fungal-type domain-containing protein [Fusarium sp. Ph1]|nr:Zn(2)-C6 fungal-type domain-containing protein [Fusarium sp. Ph1]
MGKRLRACEACHNLEAKCEPSINDPSVCERCTRSSLICVPAARRWQRDRIAELEEQVKNLQEILETAESSTYRLPGHETR